VVFLQSSHHFIGAGGHFYLQLVVLFYGWRLRRTAHNFDDLVADETFGTQFHFGIFADKVAGSFFYVHFYAHLFGTRKFNFFYRANFHARKPDIIAYFKPGHIVENRGYFHAFYKALLLAAKHKNGRNKNGQPQRNKNAYKYKTFTFFGFH